MSQTSDPRADDVRVLVRALDQAADVLDQVRPGDLDRPTPCADWSVAELVDHLSAAPGHFLTLMRGEQPDWSAPPPHVAEEWGPNFRPHADDLAHAWHERDRAEPGDAPGMPADGQTAEFAVHTWDLATAIGYPVDRLASEVAERAFAFMSEHLSDEARGAMFGPAQPAADDADPYTRLAAFAGRRV